MMYKKNNTIILTITIKTVSKTFFKTKCFKFVMKIHVPLLGHILKTIHILLNLPNKVLIDGSHKTLRLLHIDVSTFFKATGFEFDDNIY